MNYSMILIPLLVLGLVGCDLVSGPEGNNPSLSLEADNMTVSQGSSVVLTANITDFDPTFFALSMRIAMDQNSLLVDEEQTGWKGDIWSSSAIGLLKVESNVVHISVTQLAGGDDAIAGGSVFTIRCTAVKSGEVAVDLLTSQLTFYDSGGNEIPFPNLQLQGGLSLTIN